MKEFEAVIGLELHIEMRTKSKMFSSAPVTYGAEANTQVAPLDIAFPGAMPLVNKQAVINGIRVANALHMQIDNELWFDRKNYFYSDLPKGYQITQDNRPLGRDGYLNIGSKTIGIERLHLEEDTCKQIHLSDRTLLDFNRAGIPLVEIVSRPEITNGEEAMKFVEKIRSIVQYLDVSDGKMEKGSLRCDVNVSIKEKGNSEFGTKVEIKNLNSLNNIKRAIDYEINKQKETLLNGGEVIQETKRFDERRKATVRMRIKTDAVDYKCLVDPNIPPIPLSEEFINEAIKSSPKLAEEKKARYQKLGLNDYDSSLILADKDVSKYFDRVIATGADIKLAANWLNVDIQAILSKNEIGINDFSIEPERLGELIKLIEDGQITNKQAREIFNKMLDNNLTPKEIMVSLGTSLIKDEEAIKQVIIQVLNENPQVVKDYKNGKNNALRFIVGQVMKLTKGKVNPELTNKLIIEELKRR